MRVCLGVAAVAAVLLASGCTSGGNTPPEPTIRPQWQEIKLPVPPGPGSRVMVRESVRCAGTWYVVGAVGSADGVDTKPAVWASKDGAQWTVVPMTPKTYYGERSILYSVGCREGKIALIGSKAGGAHGNPRVTTWYQQDDGSLIEVISHFELYNGPNFMNVARMIGGPSGWLIVGNRVPGAAVWLSPDAHKFDIVEGAPELASDPRGETWAFDAAPVPGGWMVVGGLLPPHRIDRDPASWRSPDGTTWSRTVLAGTGDYEELQRVVVSGQTIWAAGLLGPTFGVWRMSNNDWVKTGRFSHFGNDEAPSVKSFITDGNGLLMAGSAGSAHELWASPDGSRWRQVALPAAAPVGAERTISLSGPDQHILLLIDDGKTGRAWFGDVSVTF